MKNWKYIEGAKTGNAGITDKEFNSESEMRRWCIEHNYTYTPVGGGYYRLEDDSGKNRKDLEAHVKAGNKTGNIKDDAKAKELHKKMMDAKEIAEEWGRASNYQKKDNLEGGRKAAEDAYRKAKKEYEDYAMNSKTGNDTPWKYAHRKPKVINDDKTGAEEFFKELADDAKEREDKDKQEVEKLVENSTVSEYNAEIQRLTRKAEQLRRMGQGKSAMEVEKQIEKLGKELAEVSNSKVGNVASEYEILKHDPSKMHPMYKKAYEEAMKKLAREDEEFKKRFEKEYGVKAKNEASDDKFAYVMREFDEGKLKTPDGKVVTDPAQAKAIAYSESKKTENGLARARNAIKK